MQPGCGGQPVLSEHYPTPRPYGRRNGLSRGACKAGKWAGVCPVCREKIKPGEWVKPAGYSYLWRHLRCGGGR